MHYLIEFLSYGDQVLKFSATYIPIIDMIIVVNGILSCSHFVAHINAQQDKHYGARMNCLQEVSHMNWLR